MLFRTARGLARQPEAWVLRALRVLRMKHRQSDTSLAQLRLQEVHATPDGVVLLHHVLDGLDGVDDGAVVAAAEGLADLLERMAGKLAAKVHGDLPGEVDGIGPALARHIRMADLVVVGDTLLDALD